MFGWFKKPAHPHHREDDAVWVSDEARVAGVVRRAQERLAGGERVVIAATTTTLLRALQAARGATAIEVLEPFQLNPSHLTAAAQGSKTLTILLAGQLPDADGEEQLLTQNKDLPFTLRLQTQASLDEIERLGIDTTRLRVLLEQLGMTADQPIAHKWVSRALANARRKASRKR